MIREGFRALAEGMARLFDIYPAPVRIPKFRRRDQRDDAKALAADWQKVIGQHSDEDE